MDTKFISYALAEVLNSPARALPLVPLSRIRYPVREIQPYQNSDGSYTVKLFREGYGYKSKWHPAPMFWPPIAMDGIRDTLNDALPENITVSTVLDRGAYIILIIKEETNHAT